MNKTYLTLLVISVFSIFIVTNICRADTERKRTKKLRIVKKKSIEKLANDEGKSLSDSITWTNVALFGAAAIITGATMGAGAGAAAQLVGATAAPTVGSAVLTGTVIGAGAGAGLAVGGGVAALVVKVAMSEPTK